MKSFVINSKYLFDPKLNPGMDLTVDYATFVKEVGDAVDEMNDALSRGEEPELKTEQIKAILTYVRMHEDKLHARRRHAKKFTQEVLDCETRQDAISFVLKAFRWGEQYRSHSKLVVMSILNGAIRSRKQAKAEADQQMVAINKTANQWGFVAQQDQEGNSND